MLAQHVNFKKNITTNKLCQICELPAVVAVKVKGQGQISSILFDV